MKKLLSFFIPLILLVMSCHKDEEAPLRNDENVRQDFILSYDKETNQTTAKAIFEIDGRRFTLDGNESVKCNNQSYSSLSNNYYSWIFPGKQDVQFVLTKNNGEVFTNTVAFNNFDNTIANTFDSVYLNQGLVVHFSPPLQDSEGVTLYLTQPNNSLPAHFIPPQREGPAIDSIALSQGWLNDYYIQGDAVLRLSKNSSIRWLQQTDAAGGVAYLVVDDTKHFYFR